MNTFNKIGSFVMLLLAAGLLCTTTHARLTSPVDRMTNFPRLTLWAWERPTDLRSIPDGTAVAFLDQTIELRGGQAVSISRHQPLWVNPGTPLVAVVRIEAHTMAHAPLELNQAQLEQTVALLLSSANKPGIRALQIDFDAKASQLNFYRRLILALRQRMPAQLPLSITALVNWCVVDNSVTDPARNWMAGLPIDEAVPMYFRMGTVIETRHLLSESLRNQLCAHAVGVSTTETWPNAAESKAKRIYVFSDRGWSKEQHPIAQNLNTLQPLSSSPVSK